MIFGGGSGSLGALRRLREYVGKFIIFIKIKCLFMFPIIITIHIFYADMRNRGNR